MSSGGKGGGGGNAVRGYRYFFSILMGLCRGPIDQLVEIKVGDVEAWPATGSYPGPTTNSVLQTYTPGAEFPPGGFADLTGAALVDNQRFGINKPMLFGGDAGEGGIVGNGLLQMGGAAQVVTDDVKNGIAGDDVSDQFYAYDNNGARQNNTPVYVYDNQGVGHDVNPENSGGTRMPAALVPDMRGVATLWFKGQVCSNNPYPKVWKMRLRRAFQGWHNNDCWYPAKVLITFQNGAIRAMNPAHILYQVITDPVWGRGMDRSEMDDAAWVYAANRLYDEGFGLCLKWSGNETMDSFIQMVVDHISATLYVDRGTGLMTLRLLRDDYDAATLPHFTYDSGLLKADGIESGASTVMFNEIIVKFHDPVHDQERMTRAHNLASMQSLGEKIPDTKSYFGIPDGDLARRVAERDLRITSSDLKRVKLQMDRRAWKLQPGSVLSFSAPDKGIGRMIVRVATYDDGTLVNGTITLECVQDVFGMPSTLYTTGADDAYRGGKSVQAMPTQLQKVYEASYYDMVRGLTPAEAAEVTSAEGGIVITAGKPTPNALGSLITVTPEGGETGRGQTGIFSPVGVLREDTAFYDTTFRLSGGTDLGKVRPGTSAVIGDETVKVVSLDTATGTVIVGRGCADSIPQVHRRGTPIYFNDVVSSVHTPAYASGENVAVQVLPRSMNDIVDPANALPAQTVTITGRHAKPYPPGNVRINGVLPLTENGFVLGNNAAVITWASRNKVLQADQLVTTVEPSVAPEPGTTYTLRVFDRATGTMFSEQAGITGLTTTVDVSSFRGGGYGNAYGVNFDALAPVSILDFVLFTVVNGLASNAYHIPVIPVNSTARGFGLSYSYYFS